MNYICDFKKSSKKSSKGAFLSVVIEENKSYSFHFLIGQNVYVKKKEKNYIQHL